jgi:hypothetical protein
MCLTNTFSYFRMIPQSSLKLFAPLQKALSRSVSTLQKLDPIQESLLEERCILVDSTDQVVNNLPGFLSNLNVCFNFREWELQPKRLAIWLTQ